MKKEIIITDIKDPILEGLRLVLAKKEEAFATIQEGAKHPDFVGLKAFRPDDFAIPEIKALIERLEEEPYEAVLVTHHDDEEDSHA